MKREAVSSTSLRTVGYDPETQVLELEFTSGRVYQFFEVPESEFRDLMAAASKGAHFNSRIRDCYHSSQVRSPRRAA